MATARSCSAGTAGPSSFNSGVVNKFKIRVGTWNVGTLTGKLLELVQSLTRCKVDLACFQETKWKGADTRERNRFKLWYSGSRTARNGVGIIISDRLKDNVVNVIRRSDRIMMITMVIEEETVNVVCAYAPQAGLGLAEKQKFWDSLDDLIRVCPIDQRLIIGGDLNGHVGALSNGYSRVHGGFGYGGRNEEGRTILEFAIAHDLAIVNSFYKKLDSQLITFQSGGFISQIDYLLVRKNDLKKCKDCKVLPGENCSSQHKLLVMDIIFNKRKRMREMLVKSRILWKNLHGDKACTFRNAIKERVSEEVEDLTNEDADRMWNSLSHLIIETAKEILGVTVETNRELRGQREAWWYNDEIQTKVEMKKTRFREMKQSLFSTEDDMTIAKERYKEAKREATKVVAIAQDRAFEALYRKIGFQRGIMRHL